MGGGHVNLLDFQEDDDNDNLSWGKSATHGNNQPNK